MLLVTLELMLEQLNNGKPLPLPRRKPTTKPNRWPDRSRAPGVTHPRTRDVTARGAGTQLLLLSEAALAIDRGLPHLSAPETPPAENRHAPARIWARCLAWTGLSDRLGWEFGLGVYATMSFEPFN